MYINNEENKINEANALNEAEAVAAEIGTESEVKSAKGASNVLEAIENGVTAGYKAIENGVVSGYKAIENGAVKGFNKVSDKFIEKLFAKEGESVEDAKKRLSGGSLKTKSVDEIQASIGTVKPKIETGEEIQARIRRSLENGNNKED